MHGFGFGWMGLSGLLFLAAIVALLFWATSRLREAPGKGDRSREILKERFARGEIDREEFERRMKELGTWS